MALPEHIINQPFGMDAIRALCRIPGFLEVGGVYARKEIVNKLLSEFKAAGGNESTQRQKIESIFKSWARTDRPFEPLGDGFAKYRFLGYEDQSSEPSPAVVEEEQEVAEYDGVFSPEVEFGSGPCEVYAWCLPRYACGPGSRWPVKIGRTGVDGLLGRLTGSQENLPERPRYLARLGCVDEAQARERERLLHHFFTSRGQKIEDLPGNEWFLTNIEEIVAAIGFIVPPASTE